MEDNVIFSFPHIQIKQILYFKKHDNIPLNIPGKDSGDESGV